MLLSSQNMHRRIIVALLAVLLIWATAMTVATQHEPDGLIVSDLNVRVGPGLEYDILTQVVIWSQVKIEGQDTTGNWLLIHTPDNTIRGWVTSQYVTLDTAWELLPIVEEILSPTIETPQDTTQDPLPETLAESPPIAELPSGVASGTVNVLLLRVRSGASAEYRQIGELAKGAEVAIEGRNTRGDWILVHRPDLTLRGWVASAYVTFETDLAALPVLGNIEITAQSGGMMAGMPASTSPEAATATPFILEGNEPELANNIAITIDDCSIEENVRWALNILRNRGLTATFFPNTLNIVKQDPQLWRDIVAAGMEIGYHTRFHMSWLTPEELDTDFTLFTQEVRDILGDPDYSIRYIRPPRGAWDENWLSWGESRGLITVRWNVVIPDNTLEAVIIAARNRRIGGSILLMHTGRTDLQWLQDNIDAMIWYTNNDGERFKPSSITDALND